jgi:hypothetical protein
MPLSKEAKKFFEREGRKGAMKVYKKYGLEHYKKMAQKRWAGKKKLSPPKDLT